MQKSDHSNTNSNISDIIAKYKTIYQKITPVYSPAVKQTIYFNAAGFKHLIFKGQHRRQNKVIYSRMVLIPLIVPVIKKCQSEVEVRIRKENIKGKPTTVTYKALEAKVGNSSTRVRVVLRKHGKNGRYYFQSVMKYN